MYLLDSGLRKGDEGQVGEGLGLVREMVSRIRKMVLDVLLFSKDRRLHFTDTPVAEFAEDASRGIEPLVREHDIGFVVECPEDAGSFEVDSGLLRTALVNVLENAVDACLDEKTRQSHRIVLRIGGDWREVVFQVEDDGVGMDEETRAKMTNLFFSSKDRKGTGLGLYITSRTVREHGGVLEAESQPGRGTIFTIRIPRKAGPPGPDAGEKKAPQGMPPETKGKELHHGQEDPGN
jgi:signal transduction histidine kinase